MSWLEPGIKILRERCRNFAGEMGACAVFLVGHRGQGIAAILSQPDEQAAAAELANLGRLFTRPAFIARVHANREHSESSSDSELAAYAVAVSTRAVFALAFVGRSDITDDVRIACRSEADHLADLIEDLKGTAGGGGYFGGGGNGGPGGDDARMWIGVEEKRREPN
jgi:hypothetical protein